jgi:hypothetical protein
MQLGAEDVLRLSPDESSAKAAKGLVIPAKWPRLEFDEQAVWGECQGSGAKPYQVQVDKSGPAFRCSCPSRKFPCKHGLALLLLLAQNPGSFAQATPPAWVSEWLSSRDDRAEKQEAKQAQATEPREAPADPQAAARREASRLQRMAAGLEDLERWLADRLRQGLAALPAQPALWDEMATRMVDAQLPGLAFRLRRIATWVGQGDDWPARVLAGLGQLQVLSGAFRRLDALPAPVRTDVRSAVGITLDGETVLANGEKLADDWRVLGQSIDAEDRLWVRRVWLQGVRSGRRAMLLDYAHGTRRFEDTYVTGACRAMTVVFFPGNAPLRALALDDAQPSIQPRAQPAAAPAQTKLDEALDTLSQAVAANPWQWPQPMLFGDGVPRFDAVGWCLQTAARQRLRLAIRDENGWRLLAESGGQAVTVFGEWDGEALRPLSCWNPTLVWTEAAEAA